MNVKKDLEQLMLAPGPSGYEHKVAYLMMDMLRPFCDEVSLDKVGNVIACVRGTDGANCPRVMVYGHMDSLGFIVRRIEDNGYIQVDRLGGIQEKALPALRVLIRDENGGWHPGVIGTKSHHASTAEEKYKVDLVTHLFFDVGAKSAKEVHDMGIEIGCPVICSTNSPSRQKDTAPPHI